MLAALDDLTARLGPDPAEWKWGKLHTLVQKHFLSLILFNRSRRFANGVVLRVALRASVPPW